MEQPSKQTVVCPNCQSPTTILPESIGTMVICPTCGSSFFPGVSSEGDLPPAHHVDEPSLLPESVGESYSLSVERSVDPVEVSHVRPSAAPAPPPGQSRLSLPPGDRVLLKAAKLPPPPRWTFFSGVYTFPWYAGSVWRWLFLTLGLLLAAECFVFAFEFGGLVGVGFFSPALIFIAAFSVAAAGSIFQATVQDTANGYNVIENWDDSDFRDWFGPTFVVAMQLLLAIIVGVGLHALAGGETPAAVFAIAGLLFPVFYLSAMEASSPLVPVTMPITRTLTSHWYVWLLFYFITGLLLAGLVAALKWLSRENQFVAAAIAPLLLTTGWFIYARLLGRLGWRVSEDRHKRPSRRPR